MSARLAILAMAVLLAALAVSCGQDLASEDLREADSEYSAGNYSRAQRIYQAYIEDNPEGKERWHAWNRIVDITLGVERNPQKATALLESMKLEFEEEPGRLLEILKRLAGLYKDTNKREQALETWNKVLYMSGADAPDAPAVYLEMGEIHQLNGDYSLARDTMLQCLEECGTPEPEACVYGLARYLSLLGNDAQAQVWLEKLTAKEGVDTELRAQAVYMLSGIYAELGRTGEARELLLSIQDIYPNPKAVEARLKHLR